MKASSYQYKTNHFMQIISLGRLVYGLILLAAGTAVFNLLGKNLGDEMLRLLSQWQIDSHLFYVNWLMRKVSTVIQGLLVLLAVGNILYAALAFIEAGGLLLGKRWAYWLVNLLLASLFASPCLDLFVRPSLHYRLKVSGPTSWKAGQAMESGSASEYLDRKVVF